MVLKSAAKLKHLAPDAICVTDPLAFSGCGRGRGQASSGPDEERTRGLGPGQIPHQVALGEEKVAVGVTAGERKTATNGHANGSSGPKKLVGGLAARNGIAKAISGSDRPVHPVTLWRGRLSVAIDALETDPDAAPAGATDRPRYARRSPVETTHVQLPTGDRLLVPTGAETLRLKGYLIMCRNSRRDYADFADMVDAMEPETAAVVLAGMDRYYCCESSRRQCIATQLVRRLADPDPCDYPEDQGSEADANSDWEGIRERCLSVAVAMLEEAR